MFPVSSYKYIYAEFDNDNNDEQNEQKNENSYNYEKNNYLLFIEQNIGLNRYNAAQKLLEEFKAKYPNNQERKFYYLSAILNEKKADYLKAVQDYQKAINIYPGYSQARNGLGSLYLKLGRYSESEAELLKAAEINPYNPFINYNIGDLYYKIRKYEPAEKYLARAIKYKANYGEAFYKLGLVFYKTNKLEMALEHLEKALQFNNTSHETYYYIGMANNCLGKTDAAILNLKKALKIKNNFYKGFLELGKLFQKQKDYKNAVKHFLIAESINFDDITVRISLAECYAEMKRYDDAVDVIEKLMKSNYNNEELWEMLSQVKEKKYSD